jgi:hypothetical protein
MTAARAFPVSGHVVETAAGVGLGVGDVAGLLMLGPLQPARKISPRTAMRFTY